MAEELDGQEVVEPAIAPEDGGKGEEENVQNNEDSDPIEALAAEMGWAPKDQFRGDEADWKPASEFIKAGRDINRSMARELRGVREEVTRIAQTSAQITADKIAERDAYWQGVHAKAVEDGDGAVAKRAVDELVKLKSETTAAPAGPPPETTDFIERHKAWFGKDPLATSRAKRLADELAADGYDTAEQLRQVERAIRKEFPEHFPAVKQPAGVQTGQARNANRANRQKGFADMPAESQAMARDYLERHGIPLEKTAASYWAQNERKVG